LPAYLVICALFLSVDKKKIFSYVLPFLLIGAGYVIFRLFFLPCSKCTLVNLFSLVKIKAFIFLFQDYLGQLVLPTGLRSLFFSNIWLVNSVFIVLALVITIGCLVGAIWFKQKILAFGLLFYFAGLLPVLNLIDHIEYFGVILSEHYLYLPCIGIFIILASAIIFLEKKNGIILKALLAALLGFYFCLTIINNNYYKNQVVFYRHLLSLEKNHSFARVNLGNAYLQKNMFDQAINEAQATLNLEPDAWDAYLLLGNAYKGKGQIDQAVKFYRKTIQLNPVGIQGYLNLGITLAEAEDTVAAQKVLEDALIKFPDSVDLHRNLGALYGNTGNLKKAISVWQEGLVLDPNDQGLMDNIGFANELLENKPLK
jgi:Tfp pilus assembly protein PilF